MMIEKDVKKLSKEITEFINKNKFEFRRGEPQKYFEFMSIFNQGLTLPIVDSNIIKAIEFKNYFNLWNILIDDDIDYNKSLVSLITSQQYLRKSNSNYKKDKGIESLVEALIRNLPTNELYFLLINDLEEIILGFKYEYLINSYPALYNSSDYIKYSTKTTSLKYFLDIDFLLSENKKYRSSFNDIRNAYSFFEIAIKLASDLGTFERESKVEYNLNLVIIRMVERGWINLQDYILGKIIQFNQNELREIVNEIKEESLKSLEEGLGILSRIKTFNTSLISQNIDKLVKTYINSDPFFK